MSTTIDYRDGVAVGLIVAYSPLLIGAIGLIIRHGFGRSSGWQFLVIFSLARLLGAAFQLAEINDPSNVSLYIGAAVLQNIGLSPLELVTLGLLSRVTSNINRSKPTLVTPQMIKLVQLVVTVGLILSIVGGVQSGNGLADPSAPYVPTTLSKVAVILYLLSYVALVLAAVTTCFSIGHAEAGEKRLMYAVMFSLPFLFVRLLYSLVGTLGNVASFNSITGNVTILLVMAFIMELIIVIVYEVVGFTIGREASAPVLKQGESISTDGQPDKEHFAHQRPQHRKQRGGVLGTLGRRTIIGSIITSFTDGHGEDYDVELGQAQHRPGY